MLRRVALILTLLGSGDVHAHAMATSPAPKAANAKSYVRAARAKASKRATRSAGRRRSQYAAQVRKWHEPEKGKGPIRAANGLPKLVLESINTAERLELEAVTDQGGFRASDLERVAWLFRDTQNGTTFPVDPMLLDLVYKLQRRFEARSVRFVSAYRTARSASESRHGQGRALDLIVPGVADEQVADFLEKQGFTGVGLYIGSGFVHLDVRSDSHFWIDRSGPGQRGRPRAKDKQKARASDTTAVAERRARPRASALPLADVDGTWRIENP